MARSRHHVTGTPLEKPRCSYQIFHIYLSSSQQPVTLLFLSFGRLIRPPGKVPPLTILAITAAIPSQVPRIARGRYRNKLYHPYLFQSLKAIHTEKKIRLPEEYRIFQRQLLLPARIMQEIKQPYVIISGLVC